MWETMWTFKTARFAVHLQITECMEEPDWLDGPEQDELLADIRSGAVTWFDSRVIVCVSDEIAPRIIGFDTLGGSDYRNIEEFWTAHRTSDPDNRNTLAMKARNTSICHYFPDMVRNAVRAARVSLKADAARAASLRAFAV